MDNKKVWSKVSGYIKSQISLANFKTWFSSTDISSITNDCVILSVPHAFIMEQLNLRYLNLIEEAFKAALDKKVRIEFKIDPSKSTKNADENIEEIFQTDYQPQRLILNPKFTLQNFVVGLSNNVAYAAALAVVQNPGNSYNPLFLYGGTGVGKTHLMIGIGNAILQKNPHIKVIYCSSEKFTNDYVEAIQTRRMGDLRNRYRSLDLLLIDDIQFFSGREGTQEEFFHTFNELLTKNGQIVMTSDRTPNDIAKLEDRLKSRFQGGLMIDIQLPDFDTRVAILRAKCLEREQLLSEDVLNLIASTFETNARELEGKLIQILQLLKAQNKEATPEFIQQILGPKQKDVFIHVSYKQVLSTVCNYFNIRLSDLVGPKRNKQLVLPRHIVMHLLSEDLNMTVEKIGDILGGRDHTTVMHGRDKIKKLILNDREVQKIFIEVKQSLTNFHDKQDVVSLT